MTLFFLNMSTLNEALANNKSRRTDGNSSAHLLPHSKHMNGTVFVVCSFPLRVKYLQCWKGAHRAKDKQKLRLQSSTHGPVSGQARVSTSTSSPYTSQYYYQDLKNPG